MLGMLTNKRIKKKLKKKNQKSGANAKEGKTQTADHKSRLQTRNTKNPKILVVFSFILFLISYSFQNPNPKTPNSTPSPSAANKKLTNYGFPVGLLPATRVLGYAVNLTSGDFSVPPDNYVATYSKRITGKIVKGRIAELDGIRVWAFFKWWYIPGIPSTGVDIVFEVGMVTAKYPSMNFDDSPACEGQYSAS